MTRIQTNNIEISYDLCGSGEPLVLIGGFGMTKEFWSLQVQALSPHFKVLTFDNRGAGKSTVPSEPFSLADMASDTIALMDALNISAAHILGVSMGGMIAQLLCMDYPDRIKKAVLGCTSHGGRNATQPEPGVMVALAQAANPDLSPEEAARQLVPYLFSESFVREEKERIEAFIRLSVANCISVEGAAGQMNALGCFNAEKRLGEIHCPVMVVAGSGDRLIPPENSRFLSEKIPGAALRLIQDAGHNFFFEKFDEVNEILRLFFSAP